MHRLPGRSIQHYRNLPGVRGRPDQHGGPLLLCGLPGRDVCRARADRLRGLPGRPRQLRRIDLHDLPVWRRAVGRPCGLLGLHRRDVQPQRVVLRELRAWLASQRRSDILHALSARRAGVPIPGRRRVRGLPDRSAGKTPPLPCRPTVGVAKALPFLAVLARHEPDRLRALHRREVRQCPFRCGLPRHIHCLFR